MFICNILCYIILNYVCLAHCVFFEKYKLLSDGENIAGSIVDAKSCGR